MKFTQLKDDLLETKRNVYLLEGDDAYFRSSGEEQIKQKFLQFPELNFASFEGESLKGNGIYHLADALAAYPFMSEYRVIRVREFYPSESEYKNFKEVLNNFPQSSVLIIINKESKGTDLKRKAEVSFVDCNRADEETVTRWIYLTLKRGGVASSVEICALIARYCLCNMSRVALEIEKIIAYKNGSPLPLTQEEADSLVYKDAEYKVYEMTDAACGNYKKYLAVQKELCKKSGDETYVLTSLHTYFKNLLTIISSGKSDAELAEILKMKEYGVKKSRERANSFGEKRLIELTEVCYNALSDIKSGKVSEKSALICVNNVLFFKS